MRACVLGQVRKRALEQIPVAEHGDVVVTTDVDLDLGARAQACGDLVHERRDLHMVQTRRHAGRLHAGEQQQRMREPAESADFAFEIAEEHLAVGGNVLRARLQDVDRRGHRGQWRQQLVRGVRDELALCAHAFGHLASRDKDQIGALRGDPREAALEQEPVSLAMQQPELAELGTPLGQAEREGLAHARRVGRVDERDKRSADEFLGPAAELALMRR